MNFESDQSTVLVVTDLSKQAHGALHVGQDLARDSGSRLKVLHVVDMLEEDNPLHVFFDGADELEARVMTDGQSALQAHVASVLGDEHGAELQVKFGHPVNDIIRAAHFDDNVALVVAGTTGHGRIHNAVFGSTIGRVIRECDKPILVVPPGIDDHRVKSILAPVDMSDCSRRSLGAAIALAKAGNGKVFVFSALHIPPVTPFYPAMPAPASNLLEARAKKRHQALEAWVAEIGAGDVAEVLTVENVETISGSILETAQDQGVGLICMGSHGRSGLERALMGSVTERVLRRAKLPVLVVP